MPAKTPPLITVEEQRAERMRRLAFDMSRTDRVLSGRPVTVEVVPAARRQSPLAPEAAQRPAWSMGSRISIPSSSFEPMSTLADIARIYGLNLHELCHVMWTPGERDPMVSDVRKKGMFPVFNLLEDQRIETIMVGMWPSTAAYLASVFMHFIAADEKSWPEVHLLSHGRRYLPLDVRLHFRDLFTLVDADKTRKMERVVDQYRRLVLPRDSRKAFKLVRQLHNLLPKDPADQDETVPLPDPYKHGKEACATASSMPDQAGQTQGQRGAGEVEKRQAKEERKQQGGGGEAKKDAEKGAGESSGEEGTSDTPQGGPSGQGRSQGRGEAGRDDADEGDGTPGSGWTDGGTDAAPRPPAGDTVVILQAAIEDQVAGADAQGELRAMRDRATSRGHDMSRLDRVGGAPRPVPVSVAQTMRGVAKHLKRVVADADPGWDRGHASGRLSMDRAMRGHDVDTVFDRWEEGQQDAGDVCLVVLFDVSYSMKEKMARASQSLWAMKRALDEMGAESSVVAFNQTAHLLFDQSQRAEKGVYKEFGASGGTNPKQAVHEARHLLHMTTRRRRGLIIFTDGQFNSEVDQAIVNLQAHGISTGMAALLTPGEEMEAHGCEVSRRLHSVEDLVDFTKVFVTDMMSGSKKGRGQR